MFDKRSERSKDDSDLPTSQGRYSDNGGKADFTRRQFQRSREFEDLHPEVREDLHPKAEASLPRMLLDREIYGRFSHKVPITESTTYTREQMRHRDVSYQDFLNMQEKLRGDAKGQWFDSTGQSDGPNPRRLTKQDHDQWLKETEQYVHSQPDSVESEWSQRLFAFNMSFEALKQDMNLFLIPEEQGVLSRKLQRAHTKVELDFHRLRLLEYASDLAKMNSTGASDNRHVQSLFNANTNLYNMLMDFGVLKREIVKKIKEDFDKRFKDTTDCYQKLSKALAEAKKSAKDLMESGKGEEERQDGKARLEELEKLVKDYDVSLKYYRENNGTYFNCKQTLEKMEDIEYKIMKIIYPKADKTIEKAMKPIIEDTDEISNILDKNGITEYFYSSKAWQQKMERETWRKLLTRPPSISCIKELVSIAKEVSKVLGYCQKFDEVGLVVRSHIDSVKGILARHNLNDLLDEAVDEELWQQLGEALGEGAPDINGQAFDTRLSQFAKKVRKAMECCQEFDRVGTEVRSYVGSVNTIAKKYKKYNLNDNILGPFNEAVNEELRQVLGDALREKAPGTNGQAFDTHLSQIASKVRKALECCQEFDRVGTEVCRHVDSINTIVKKYKRNDLLESFNEELRQVLGDALQEVLQGTNGQVFKDLHQFTSKVQRVVECCQKFDELGTEVRSHLDSIDTIVKKYKKYNLDDNILGHFNEAVDEELGQLLGEALGEGVPDTNRQAFNALSQLASKVRKAMECCQEFDWVGTLAHRNIEECKDILAKHNRNDLLESFDEEFRQELGKALNEAVDKALRQKRDDTLQEGARGTNGQDFKTLDQFDSKVRKARRCCQKVDKVGTNVRSYLDSVKGILARHNLNDILDEAVDEELRRKLDDALNEAVDEELWQKRDNTLQEEARGTNEQAFKTLRQFASEVRKVYEDCHTINEMVVQLKKNSNEAEVHELQQEHNRALLEAIQGLKAVQAGDKKPAFNVLEQRLDKEMQERHRLCRSKIADMQSLYDGDYLLQPSETDFRQSFVYLRIETSDKGEYLTTRYIKLPNLKELSDQFDEQRKNAQKKSDGERIEDNRILMRALSDIEKSTQGLEKRSEVLVGYRFNRSQRRARATNYWQDLHPDDALVDKYKEACKHFVATRTEIQAASGEARTKGYLELGKTLSSIESLEGELQIAPRFDRSQARARATNYWLLEDFHPDETLVDKYKWASKRFVEMSAKFRTASDDAKTEIYLELGKTLSSIESLEDKIRDSSTVEVFRANPFVY